MGVFGEAKGCHYLFRHRSHMNILLGYISRPWHGSRTWRVTLAVIVTLTSWRFPGTVENGGVMRTMLSAADSISERGQTKLCLGFQGLDNLSGAAEQFSIERRVPIHPRGKLDKGHAVIWGYINLIYCSPATHLTTL